MVKKDYIALQDEYLDLVDESDKVIGKKKRSEVYELNLSNFRVVNAFVKNKNGKLWIPRRVANKRIFPLCLDMSLAGHVSSGETYDQAFKRELKEELNLEVSKIPYRFLGHLTPHQHGVSAFMNVYEIEAEDVHYNQKDFVEYFWLTPQQILDRLAQGDKSKEDLPRLVRIFYLQKKIL